MNMEVETPAVVEKRKLLLFAPMVVVPMLALGFYGLGGGKGVAASGPGVVRGVNMSLPMAQLNTKDKTLDKLDLYAKAAQDSAKWLEKKKQDPYAAGNRSDSVRVNRLPAGQQLQTGTSVQQLATDAAADRVLQQLAQVKSMIGQGESGRWAGTNLPAGVGGNSDGWAESNSYPHPTTPKSTGSNTDPEMNRLDGMLDKLIKIQHPEMVNRDTETTQTTIPNRLQQPGHDDAVRVLGDGSSQSTGFMEIGEIDPVDSNRAGHDDAIEAFINGDQTLTAGSTVALRLSQEAIVNGTKIPAGQGIYGLASLSGERLMVGITSLRVGQSILNVSLQVYDLDGLPGIRVPGALTRDVSKESASEALGGLGIASLDPSLSAQAASAGLQMAKSLASRKVRLVRVTLPNGYRVLLRNVK